MYQPSIFISAVTAEHQTTRQRIANVLSRMGYRAVWQETFSTEAGDLRGALRDKIDACEGLLQIVGDAYGAEPPVPDPEFGRVSYTQFEFLYARHRGKKTWLILPQAGCTRDTPLERLDLPEGPHPDPRSFQFERRRLQAAYRAQLRESEHFRHEPLNNVELELQVERLRDELSTLRHGFQIWQRIVAGGVAAAVLLLAGVLAALWWMKASQRQEFDKLAVKQQEGVERIRDGLLEAADRRPDEEQLQKLGTRLEELEKHFEDSRRKLVDFRRGSNPGQQQNLPESLETEKDSLREAVDQIREQVETYVRDHGSLPVAVQQRKFVLERAESMLKNPLDFVWEEPGPNKAPPVQSLMPLQRASLVGHSGTVQCLSFSADGKLLATGSADKTVRIWDTTDWSLRSTLRGYESAVQCVGFSPDGRLLAWGGDGGQRLKVKVWNVPECREHATLTFSVDYSPSRVSAVVFSPDNHRLAAASNGPFRVWNVDEPQQAQTLPWQQLFPSYGYAVAFSPDGQTLAGGCHGGDMGDISESVRQWKWSDGLETDTLIGGNDRTLALSHSDVRGAVAFSPDGKKLMRVTKGAGQSHARVPPFGRNARGPVGFSSGIGSLMIWDLEQGEKAEHEVPGGNAFSLAILRPRQAAPLALRTNANRDRVFVASVDGPKTRFGIPRPGFEQETDPSALHLWDTERRAAWKIATSHKQGIVAVALTADASHAATAGSESNAVKIWDVAASIARMEQ